MLSDVFPSSKWQPWAWDGKKDKNPRQLFSQTDVGFALEIDFSLRPLRRWISLQWCMRLQQTSHYAATTNFFLKNIRILQFLKIEIYQNMKFLLLVCSLYVSSLLWLISITSSNLQESFVLNNSLWKLVKLKQIISKFVTFQQAEHAGMMLIVINCFVCSVWFVVWYDQINWLFQCCDCNACVQ